MTKKKDENEEMRKLNRHLEDKLSKQKKISAEMEKFNQDTQESIEQMQSYADKLATASSLTADGEWKTRFECVRGINRFLFEKRLWLEQEVAGVRWKLQTGQYPNVMSHNVNQYNDTELYDIIQAMEKFIQIANETIKDHDKQMIKERKEFNRLQEQRRQCRIRLKLARDFEEMQTVRNLRAQLANLDRPVTPDPPLKEDEALLNFLEGLQDDEERFKEIEKRNLEYEEEKSPKEEKNPWKKVKEVVLEEEDQSASPEQLSTSSVVDDDMDSNCEFDDSSIADSQIELDSQTEMWDSGKHEKKVHFKKEGDGSNSASEAGDSTIEPLNDSEESKQKASRYRRFSIKRSSKVPTPSKTPSRRPSISKTPSRRASISNKSKEKNLTFDIPGDAHDHKGTKDSKSDGKPKETKGFKFGGRMQNLFLSKKSATLEKVVAEKTENKSLPNDQTAAAPAAVSTAPIQSDADKAASTPAEAEKPAAAGIEKMGNVLKSTKLIKMSFGKFLSKKKST